MISLRTRAGIAATILAFTACRDLPTPPTQRVAPSTPAFDGKVGDPGNAAKNGSISVRALLDVSGAATLEVRTGTYNAQTNTGVPDGYFESIQYKISNAAGKQVLVKSVKLGAPGVSLFTTPIDLCDGQTPCTARVGAGWTVSVQADLKGVGGDDRKTDVVRAESAFAQTAPAVPVDVSAGALERVGNGVSATTIIPLDTSVVGKTITVRSIIQNSSASSTTVDCSVTSPAHLKATAVGPITNVVVPAGGTAVCQYALQAIALGTFPVSISVAPSAGVPADPNMSNNSASGSLRVVAAGRFTSIDLTSVDLQQQWFNLVGANAFPAESLTLQNVRAGQLALLVVPSQSVIGTFTLNGTVVSESMTFPTGTVTGTLHQSAGGVNCGQLTMGPNAPFANAPAGFPSQVGYFGEICAEPVTVNGVAGFQQVSISYVQSLSSSMMNPGAYLLTGTVRIKIELSFTLQGATTADKATATISIVVPNPIQRSLTNLDGTRVLFTEQNPSPPIAVTP
jgi:hypothetical protein